MTPPTTHALTVTHLVEVVTKKLWIVEVVHA